MYNRFTDRARKCIIFAKEEAKRFNHDHIGTEHLLLGLVREGESVAAAVLQKLGLDLETIRLEVEKLVQPSSATLVVGDIPFTPGSKKALEFSAEEARTLGHNYIGAEHLLLGLVKEGEGMASRVLLNLGVDLQKVRNEVMELLGSGTPNYGQQQAMPDEIKKLEEQIVQLIKQKESFMKVQDFIGAAKIREQVRAMKEELERKCAEWKRKQETGMTGEISNINQTRQQAEIIEFKMTVSRLEDRIAELEKRVLALENCK